MERHLYSEEIEAEIEDNYWLSQENVESWEGVSERVDRGNIGSQDVYRKQIVHDDEFVSYSLTKAFFENFELEYSDIPQARIEEENGVTYLLTEGITGTRSRMGEKEAFGFASEMTLLGETDWHSNRNTALGDKPILQDFEYFGRYLINDPEDFYERCIKPWFEGNGVKFKQDRFEREIRIRAEEIPKPEEVTQTLLERTETHNRKQEEIREESINKLEKALKTARKEELTIDYISAELSDVN